ncbi:MAG: hypothetical protein QW584_03670 [Thermofilaceae archaeon]
MEDDFLKELKRIIEYATDEESLIQSFQRISPIIEKMMELIHKLNERKDEESIAVLAVLSYIIEAVFATLAILFEPNSKLIEESAERKLLQLLVYCGGLEKITDLESILEKVREIIELFNQFFSVSQEPLPY